MKQYLKNNYWILLLIPAVFVFKSLILGGAIFGGDAPYFYPNALKTLFSEPLVWTQRGNAFGGVNLALWLGPIMVAYGALGKFVHLGNDAIVRILFLFPSLILSFVGPYLLARYLKFGKITQFFASLLYVFNTYFLLLIDGGQVGVALAYGIFPFTLLFLKKFTDKPKKGSFFLALLFSFALSLVDPRILVICFLSIFLWSALEEKFTFWLIPLGILLILLNFYWIYPFLKLGTSVINTTVSNLGLLSLINPLFLFSPHWPANNFGKIVFPPYYFVVVPLIVFGGLLFKERNKKVPIIALLLLVFAFLSKGLTPPLGINLGLIFRDSSKFFVLVILFAGILFGETVDKLQSKFKHSWLLGYLFIILLISPAIIGKMNFLLSNHVPNPSYQKIAQNLSSQEESFRSVWLTRKEPLSYESKDKPAVDGIELASYFPFANLNTSEDVFNFLNNTSFIDRFRVLGIKYLFLNGNARNLSPDKADIESWQAINTLIEKAPGLTKLNWDLDFPAYEVSNLYPRFYSVENLLAVVGPGLESNNAIIPSIYFEDGKLDPRELIGKKPDSLKIYFNGKSETDLIMSFVQKYFLSPSENKSSQWAIFGAKDYLKYKYELLIRGYQFKDFDYAKGIAFSSIKGESISFKFKVPKNGNYILTKRVSDKEIQSLHWETEEKTLTKGSFDYEVVNNSGLQVMNVVALIPAEAYQEAQELAEGLIKDFGVVNNPDNKIGIRLVEVLEEGTLKYKVTQDESTYWIVFSDNYNPFWKLKKGVDYFSSVPVYSMLNAFYVEPTWNDLHIEFKGQETFRWGVWISILTILSLIIYFLYEKKNN
ncbi:6-pyruvoyl-tetrahydropterin synthase-related protein [Patescibacteria group bacterium]